MRVRPFFWAMLTVICIGILLFAEIISMHRSTPMQVHIDQVSTATFDAASIRLRLTDSEGLPIERASIIPQASMPTMLMAPQQIEIEALGQGLYMAHIRFSMTGAWQVEITAHADGFAPAQQSLALHL